MVCGDSTEKGIKLFSDLRRFLSRWLETISLDLVVKLPKLLEEIIQLFAMIVDKRGEFFVVPSLMDPAEGLLGGNKAELRGIVTEKHRSNTLTKACCISIIFGSTRYALSIDFSSKGSYFKY